MADFLNNYAPSQVGGALDAAVVTPSDTADLAPWARGFQITTDGAVTVTTAAGNTVTFPAGTFAPQTPVPLAVRRVWATGTTAGRIVAFY